MNEQEKSVKLDKLMSWKAGDYYSDSIAEEDLINPYGESTEELAQFAKILLRFPEVFAEFDSGKYGWERRNMTGGWDVGDEHKPTQSNILDEILCLYGDVYDT